MVSIHGNNYPAARPSPVTRTQTNTSVNRRSLIQYAADILIPSKRSQSGSLDQSRARRHRSTNVNPNNQNLLPVHEVQPVNNRSENIREVKPSESLAQTGHANLQFQTKPDVGTEKELIKDFESLRYISESAILTIADEWEGNRDQSRAGRMNSNIRSAIWPITGKWKEHLSIVLGRHLYGQLKNARSRLPFPDYQNVVSNALSTIVSHKVFEIVSIEFAPGLSSESRQEFDSVFRDLLSTGPSHDALRWRASAYATLTRGTRSERVEEFRKNHLDDLLDAFRTILYVGGVRFKYLTDLEDILSKSEIIEKAIQFGEKMKTQYFSIYPDVFIPNLYEAFEGNTMEVIETEQIRVRPSEPGSYEVGYTLFPGLLIRSPSNDIKDRILVKCQIAQLGLVQA